VTEETMKMDRHMSKQLLYLFLRLFFLCLSYAGNTCIILVMRHATWRKRADTTKLLFCVLAVIDMCYMTTRVIFTFITIVVLESQNMIDIVFYGVRVSGVLMQTSLCVLTILSMERVVCVFHPFNVHEYCNLRKIKIVLAVSIIVTFLLCVLETMMDIGMSDVSMTLSFAIPATIITLTTSAIVIKLCFVHKQELGRGRAGMSNTDATGLLIAANVCFLVTILPLRIYDVFYLPMGDEIKKSNSDEVLSFCLDLLHDLNFVLNFLVYFTFSVSFRNDALILMGCRSVPGNRAIHQV